MGSSSRGMWKKRPVAQKSVPLGTPQAAISKKKEIKIPDLIICTESGVYFVKEEKLVPIDVLADKKYYCTSWAAQDLFFAGDGCLHKYNKEISEKRFYGVPVPVTVKKIYVDGRLLLTEQEDGKLVARELSLFNAGGKLAKPIPSYPETKEEYQIHVSEKEIHCRVGKDAKKIVLSDTVHDVKIIENGYTHNNVPFPTGML